MKNPMKIFFSAILLSASLCAAPALLADMVNINKATAAALQKNLKGIGEKKAQAIVVYRKEFGDFKTLDEIKEVKGIGEGIFKKIKADLSLNEGIIDLQGKAGATGKQGSASPVADQKTTAKKETGLKKTETPTKSTEK